MSARPFLAQNNGFAQTQPLSAAEFERRDNLKFFSCGCGSAPLVRINRTGWMRMLPLLRLYRCLECGARVLRGRTPPQNAYGALYLPPRPLRVAPERCRASVLDGVYKRTLSAAPSEARTGEGRQRLR